MPGVGNGPLRYIPKHVAGNLAPYRLARAHCEAIVAEGIPDPLGVRCPRCYAQLDQPCQSGYRRGHRYQATARRRLAAPPFAPLPPRLLHEARRTARLAERRLLRTLGLDQRTTSVPLDDCGRRMWGWADLVGLVGALTAVEQRVAV
ncbi:hypothetical protein ACWGJ2_12435 [Streptomyces sp. NPDC054796]